MPRYLRLNEEDMVISTRIGPEIAPGEIGSDLGECGDIRQADGTFITPEPEPYVEPLNPLEERVAALETLVLELGGVI